METQTLQQRLDETTAAVKAARDSRLADNETAYRRMLETAVDGGENDPAEVIQVLADLGLSAEKFEADCKLLANRRKWSAQVKEQRQRNEELANLQDRITALAAEQSATHQKFEHQIALLCQQRDTFQGYLEMSLHASQNLRQHAWPAQKQRLADLRAELGGYAERLCDAESHAKGLESAVASSERTLELARNGKIPLAGGDISSHEKQVQFGKQRLADARRQLASIKEVTDKLAGQIGQVELEMLEP